MVLLADAGEGLGLHAVALHVLAPGVAEHLGRGRGRCEAALRDHRLHVLVHGDGPVLVLDAEAALLHLLEAERHAAVRDAALDELLHEVERGRARGAVVVDVHDGDAGEPEPVERALPGGRVAVAVADRGLLDLVVGDACVGERLRAGLVGHVRVVPVLRPRLLELGHADPDHEHLAPHSSLLDSIDANRRALTLLDEANARKLEWVGPRDCGAMWSVRAAFVAFGFFWGTWAVAAFDVQGFLEMSDGQLGLLLAATVLGGAIANMGGGVLAERLGTRVVLSTVRSEEHTSELQSPVHLVCRLLLEKKK